MERKLAAVFAADVVGYSRLMEIDEPGTHEQFKAVVREIFEPRIAAHHGRIVKTTGDGLLVEFPSVVEAVQCGVEVEQESADRNALLPENRRLQFRIGINLGDVMVDGGDIYGDGVNVASRLEGLAEPGGICISEGVLNQVRNKMTLQVEELGRHDVNLNEPLVVYRVVVAANVILPANRHLAKRKVALRLPVAAAIVVVLAIAGALAGWWLHSRPVTEDIPVLAVMPLQNMSADPGQDYFSDGLTSDLTTDLTRIRSIFVLAASTSFNFKGKPVDVAAIHRDLGVRYIIEGSVQQAEKRVRVNVQLIDAASGIHLWAMRFDRDHADIFAVQDEILGAVVDKLKIKLSEEERKRVMAQATGDYEAYDLFLKGRDMFDNGTSRADNVAAQALFQQALARDPTMASAKAYLAHSYVKEWRHNWWEVSEQDSLEKAYQTAMTAVRLGPDNEDAHGSLAIAYLVKGDFQKALHEYDESTRLSGDHVNPDLTAEVGFAYVYMNREPEGIAKLEEAMKVNPVHPWWYESALGWAYYQNQQYNDAVRVLTSLKEDVNDIRMTLAASYARLGEMDKAKATMAEFLKNDSWTIADEAGAPFVDPNDETHWLDGLRLAGMPEGEGKTAQP